MESWGDRVRSPCFFMELNLIRLIIETKPDYFPAFTHLVSGKGAVFEKTIRDICCAPKSVTCHSCSVNSSCPVTLLLSRELSSDPEVVKIFQKPALPFVFSRNNQPDSLGLTLLGPACSYLPLILAALETMLGGKQHFRQMAVLDYQGTAATLDYSDYECISSMAILSAGELLSQYVPVYAGCTRIRLEFKSPLRLVHSTRELTCFDPAVFCRAMIRRISSLAAYYGSVDGEYDLFRDLAERSDEVCLVKTLDSSRTSSGSERGVTGCYELAGPFDLFGPYMMLTSIVQLGKRASYGMGAFDITPIS